MSLSSRSLAEARQRTRHLYRYYMRAAVPCVWMYDLHASIPQVRARITQDFRKHEGIEDIAALDILRTRGQQELEETLRVWKQRPHVKAYFDEVEKQPHSTRFSDFMADEGDPALPAASLLK